MLNLYQRELKLMEHNLEDLVPCDQKKDRQFNFFIQDLPEVAMENIMGYLRYREVNKLGTLCRLFRRVASSVLRLGLRNLVGSVERQIRELEELINFDVVAPLTVKEHLHISLLHTVLRIVLSEARMLKAVCWRYVREDIDFCFPGGELLDEIQHILNMVRDREINKDLEPEITTRLFLKAERFLDLFDNDIESSVVRFNSINATPGGVKIMDILDCCQNANYKINIAHYSGVGPFYLSALYELRDVSTLDAPPNITDDVAPEMKLRTICRYLRNNVRWINLFQPLKELWDLEDAVEHGNEDVITRALFNHHKNHQVVMADLFPDNEEARKAHWNDSDHHRHQSNLDSRDLCEDEFSREVTSYRSACLGMICDIRLESKNVKQLPLNYEFIANSINILRSPSVNSNDSAVAQPESEENECPVKETNTFNAVNTQQASTSKPHFKEDLLSKDTLFNKGAQSDVRKTKFNSQKIGWPKVADDTGKKYNFQLQMSIQYPALSKSDLVRETEITVQQTNSDVLITTKGDVAPYRL